MVGDAGPEPRVRRAARRDQKRQGSGFSTEPTGQRVALKKRKSAVKSRVCVLPLEAPFPHPPTALGQLPTPPSVITGPSPAPGAAGSTPAAPHSVMCIVSPQPPPHSSHPLLPHPYPHIRASCLCICVFTLRDRFIRTTALNPTYMH